MCHPINRNEAWEFNPAPKGARMDTLSFKEGPNGKVDVLENQKFKKLPKPYLTNGEMVMIEAIKS